jgi:recombination protein RecT
MATNASLKNKLANKETKIVSAETLSLKDLLNTPKMKKRFEELLQSRAPQFITSILNLYNSDPALHQCEPMSIISAALVAASLDLPVDKNLGYAWIVPYNDKNSKTKKAQFQLGYRGYIQLALRTGQYKSINVIEVYEGELKKWNRLTEELEIDFNAKTSDVVVGYAAYFELVNGFRKTIYWTKEQVEKHRQKYSKSGRSWEENYDAMAMKTVLRNMLAKWGILSIEMQNALNEDEKEVREVKDITNEVQETEYIEAEAFEVPAEEEEQPKEEEKPSSFEQESFDIE